jgi:glucose-1-phosphatase
MNPIRNIIFDLGAVLLDIDFSLTRQAFQDLGWAEFNASMTTVHRNPLLADYETGKLDNAQFLEGIRKQSGLPLSDGQITDAWNALILDFPEERLELLERLKGRYRLFLLSNTNSFHYDAFQQRLRARRGHELECFFERTYYSHLSGMRKPHAKFFELVLKENNLAPEQTLFVDDLEANILSAQSLGINTFHVTEGKSILDLEMNPLKGNGNR